MEAQDVADRVELVLNDSENVRWTESELALWIADAQQQLVSVIPDATSVRENVQLAAGAVQTIPGNATRLLRILRNMGRDGESPGPAVTIVRRRDLDAVRSKWSADRGREVTHYIYDPKVDRKTFWVYPQLVETTYVEMVYAKRAPLTLALNSTLEVGDEWINPLVDFTLSRAFGKNADYGNNVARQRAHYELFAQAIGLEAPKRQSVDPNRQRPGGEDG